MKYRLCYQKNGKMVYVSHLDIVRLFQRAFNRAGIDIEFSNGFHPHPKMVFSPPLPLFASSACEYVDFSSDCESEADIESRLQNAFPEGILVNYVKESEGEPPLNEFILNAEYLVEFSDLSDDVNIDSFFTEYDNASMSISEVGKKGVLKQKDYKSRSRIIDLAADGRNVMIKCVLSASQDSFASPVVFANLLRDQLPMLNGASRPKIRKLAIV